MSDISQILIKGTKVGLAGLEQAFEQVSAEAQARGGDQDGRDQDGHGRDGQGRDDRALGDRLVELVGENNYIAEAVRDDYRDALLKEYKRSLGMDIPEERSVMEIKVYGMSGCTRCATLSEDIMAVLAERGIVADFEHVTDLDRFAELGPVAPPVIAKNGKIVSSGRTLNRAQIANILEGGIRMKIQILGTGCPKCRKAYEHAEQAIRELGVAAELEKVESIKDIMKFDVMVTPAIAIDGKVKVSGKIPSVDDIKAYITESRL